MSQRAETDNAVGHSRDMNVEPSAATEHAVSERTPLLPSLEDAPALGTSVPKQHPEDRPLPTGQLLLLCFARLTEPVAFFSIFVYVNEFVYETGIPREQCGWYTGLIESLFSLVQFAVMPFWGRFSDTVGIRLAVWKRLCSSG